MTIRRWLYHLVPSHHKLESAGAPGRYTPASLATEGFVHCSFRGEVEESARLHFPAGAALDVLQIDPRRLDVEVTLADTPRGPMPHVHGTIPLDAVAARLPLAGLPATPDALTGAHVALLAFPGMTLLDLVGTWDPLSRIASMGFDRATRCEVIGTGPEPVYQEGGARLEVSRARPPLDAFDLLVLPGGRGAGAMASDAEIIAWLASYPPNRLLATVCTGALLAGAMGRLAGRRATTHFTSLDRLPALGATVAPGRVVDDGQLVTAGGVTAGIDLGLHLVRRLAGDDAAHAIARQMEWTSPA